MSPSVPRGNLRGAFYWAAWWQLKPCHPGCFHLVSRATSEYVSARPSGSCLARQLFSAGSRPTAAWILRRSFHCLPARWEKNAHLAPLPALSLPPFHLHPHTHPRPRSSFCSVPHTSPLQLALRIAHHLPRGLRCFHTKRAAGRSRQAPSLLPAFIAWHFATRYPSPHGLGSQNVARARRSGTRV